MGTTEEAAFYDDSQGKTYYYCAVASMDGAQSQQSAPVMTGTNQQPVVSVPAIMYHDFLTEEDLQNGVLLDEYAIYEAEFEEDLRWLQENGYTTITSRELCDYLEGKGTLPEKPIILTVDDGKYGVYKTAYPLLQKYDMKCVLSVIGDRVQQSTDDPTVRYDPQAPYCTWDEIREMSDSGHVEIVSHTYGLHIYEHDDRNGANTAEGESAEHYSGTAYRDYLQLTETLEAYGIPAPVALCYPYSIRSEASDKAWINAGFKLLYGGNSDDVRKDYVNHFVQAAGLNARSSLLRRIVRLRDTPLSWYMERV